MPLRTCGTLSAVLRAAGAPSVPPTDAPIDSRQMGGRIDVVFRGGTMLDALNALVVAHGQASWRVDYALVLHATETNVVTSIQTNDGAIIAGGIYLSKFKAMQ
jgi:hypothetical protein